VLTPKLPDKVFARINTRVADYPNLLVQGKGLPLVLGLTRGSKQSVSETD
jgi:hypothetical protein